MLFVFVGVHFFQLIRELVQIELEFKKPNTHESLFTFLLRTVFILYYIDCVYFRWKDLLSSAWC